MRRPPALLRHPSRFILLHKKADTAPGRFGWKAAGLNVVSRSRHEAAVLVESPRRRVDRMQSQNPDVRVFEEKWYRVARVGRPVLKSRGRRGLPAAPASARRVTVRVALDDGRGTPLPDVLVTGLIDAKAGRGDDARTDREGRASLLLPRSAKTLEVLDLDPLHGAWPKRLEGVETHDLEVVLTPIAVDEADARGLTYGEATASNGSKVRVAVIDTGVGPHRDLRVVVARNLSGQGSAKDARDRDGHGTHVAGVIASAAAGWRRGEAPDVELHAYRVFAKGADEASNFAIGEAILEAAGSGCDLINLSLGSEFPDPYIRHAVEAAWEAGCVCLAAAGNEGVSRVDYPARYAQALAVSAIGLAGSWPAGARQALAQSAVRGKPIAGRQSFLARFSNRGAKVALTAPGVGIVSTIFDDRWGVMDGTSMSTPIALGTVARRVARDAAALAMPRDRERAKRIRDLALDACEDIGLAVAFQGRGLAR